MQPSRLKLSIVIPAFNEEQRLPPTLKKIVTHFNNIPQFGFEIIVVDDGSRDQTVTVAEKSPHTRVIRLPKNQGKGAAVRAGIMAANGENILLTDADLAAPIEESKRLFFALNKGCDVAMGSRAAAGGVHVFTWKNLANSERSEGSPIIWHVRYKRYLSGRIFAFLVRLLTGLPYLDTQCGFKMFKNSAAKAIFSHCELDGFAFDVEMLCIARTLNLNVQEVAVNWSEQPGSKVSLLRDSVLMFKDILSLKSKMAKLHAKKSSDNSQLPKAS